MSISATLKKKEPWGTEERYTLMALIPMIGGIIVFTALYFYVERVAQVEIIFQDFEQGNGTPGAYFENFFQTDPAFETFTVYEGARSLKAVALWGGTVRINAASPTGYFDLRDATSLSVWVYDTQGNNPAQLRLRDSDGDGGIGDDGYFVWSSIPAQQNQWTKITWDLSSYPSVPDLDLDRIASIELYEYNSGTYYLDKASFL